MNAEIGPVLVTGAAGFIGFYLVKELRDRGVDVLAVDNLSASPWQSPPGGVVMRDVLDLSATDMYGVKTLVHLANRKVVPTSFSDPTQLVDNVRTDRHILGLIAAAKPEVALLASSCEVYGAHANP